AVVALVAVGLAPVASAAQTSGTVSQHAGHFCTNAGDGGGLLLTTVIASPVPALSSGPGATGGALRLSSASISFGGTAPLRAGNGGSGGQAALTGMVIGPSIVAGVGGNGGSMLLPGRLVAASPPLYTGDGGPGGDFRSLGT